MTGELLAVDPSVRSIGLALYRGGRLAHVGTIVCPSCKSTGRVKVGDCPVCSLGAGARCLRMAHEVTAWLRQARAAPRTLAAEWPQIYRASRSKGDPNDLVTLAGMVGTVAGMLSIALRQHDQTLNVRTFTPNEWAGGTKKTTRKRDDPRLSMRGKRIAERLDGREQLVWVHADTHDAVDAIGIGLYALNRFDAFRVLAGCAD